MDRDDHDGEIEFATRPLLCCTSSNTYISCINREGGYASLFSIHALGPQFCWWRSPNLRSTFHSKMRFLFWQLGPLPIHVGTVVTFCFSHTIFSGTFSGALPQFPVENYWMVFAEWKSFLNKTTTQMCFYVMVTMMTGCPCSKLMNWFLDTWSLPLLLLSERLLLPRVGGLSLIYCNSLGSRRRLCVSNISSERKICDIIFSNPSFETSEEK